MFWRAPARINGVPNTVLGNFGRSGNEYFTRRSRTCKRRAAGASRLVVGEVAEASELLGNAFNGRFSSGFLVGGEAMEGVGFRVFQAEI